MNQLEGERAAIQERIILLEQEVREHKLVLKAFDDVEPERRCYRMVGEVMVPRTAAEVRPALESNVKKIEEVIQTLGADLSRINSTIEKMRLESEN